MLLAVLAGPHVRLGTTDVLNVTAASYPPCGLLSESGCSFVHRITPCCWWSRDRGGPLCAVLWHPPDLGQVLNPSGCHQWAALVMGSLE